MMNALNHLQSHPHALIITRDSDLSKDLTQKLMEIMEFDSIDTVKECTDGITFAKQNNPDLIIFDSEDSVLEVLNALRAIKTATKCVQCIVIADHIGYHALLSMVGADSVLYKGFSQAELTCCLN